MVPWKRMIVGALVGSGLLVGLIGFAHTKPGRPLRPLLVALQGVTSGPSRQGSACPLGYDKGASPSDAEAARQRSVAQFKGASAAPARPALAFSLGVTTRGQVEAWAKGQGVDCQARQGPSRVTCVRVPAGATTGAPGGLDADEIFLQFDPSDRLVSVGTVRSTHDAERAVEADAAIAGELTRQVGAPTSMTGERSASFLRAGLLRQVRTEFRFSNYYATTSVTHMGQDRLVLSERYELLADGS